jgi:hypothetical protein
MRRHVFTAMAAVVAGILAAGSVAATATAATPAKATQKITVRPVTSQGRPAAGYKAVASDDGPITCSAGNGKAIPSPSAVSNQIAFCSPDAAYALACWADGGDHRFAYCLFDPTKRVISKVELQGSFGRATKPKKALPMALRLDNGRVCLLRDGGAGSSLQGHPDWAEYYFCGTSGYSVWAPMNGTGINGAHSAWTVSVARESGTGAISTRRVVQAYYVG